MSKLPLESLRHYIGKRFFCQTINRYIEGVLVDFTETDLVIQEDEKPEPTRIRVVDGREEPSVIST